MTTTAKRKVELASPRKTVVLERTYQAPVEDVWELWTTARGIESWWGPDGFTVKVRALDLRVGGELRYAMIATGPEQVEFMKRAGMPNATEHRVTFTAIAPHRRLAYTGPADFIPGVEPYDVSTLVELHPGASGVRLVLTIDTMHDEQWTKMAVMGWEMELGRLEKALAARTRSNPA